MKQEQHFSTRSYYTILEQGKQMHTGLQSPAADDWCDAERDTESNGGDRRSEDFKNSPQEKFEIQQEIPKAETIKELGFTPKQTHQFQQMAEHEDVVIETTRSRSQRFLRVL